jgi:hypothetical protein
LRTHLEFSPWLGLFERACAFAVAYYFRLNDLSIIIWNKTEERWQFSESSQLVSAATVRFDDCLAEASEDF